MRQLAVMLAVVSLAGCAKPQLVLLRPSDPGLTKKLGVSTSELRDMQSQLSSHFVRMRMEDLELVHWGRSRQSGDIEVWYAKPGSPGGGPVFFFNRSDGRWKLLTEEMSEWGQP